MNRKKIERLEQMMNLCTSIRGRSIAGKQTDQLEWGWFSLSGVGRTLQHNHIETVDLGCCGCFCSVVVVSSAAKHTRACADRLTSSYAGEVFVN
jgi:hypothetical protein